MRARSSITHQGEVEDCWKHCNRTSTPNKEKGNSENPGKPRTIVCWLLNYKDRTNILNAENLNGKTIGRKIKCKKVKAVGKSKKKEHTEEGKIAYLHYRTATLKRRNNHGLS